MTPDPIKPTADNPHGDPLIALAEQSGAFTIPGYLDRIAATAQKALDDAVPLTTTEPSADSIVVRLRAIEADAVAAYRKYVGKRNVVVPDSDKPGTERILHTDGLSGSLTLKLIDATTGQPGDDLLSVGPTPGSGIPTTGTGEEWADIALAILGHVLKRPAKTAQGEAIDLLDELVASDSLQGMHRAEARRILGMEPDEKDEEDSSDDETRTSSLHEIGKRLQPWLTQMLADAEKDAEGIQSIVRWDDKTILAGKAFKTFIEGDDPVTPSERTVECTHPEDEQRQETHTYCGADDCGACLG